MSNRLLTAIRNLPLEDGWVLEGDRKVRVAARTRMNVLRLLADHADTAGRCWPSVHTIANETRLSKRTVYRALESLERDGIIERRHRWDHRGWRTADEIQIQGATVARPSPHSGEALEAPLISKSSRCDERIDHEGEKKMPVRDTSVYEQDPGYMPPEKPKRTPSKREKKASTRPDTAMALAYEFEKRAKKIQPHMVNAVKIDRVANTFAAWKRDPENPVKPEEIRVAINLFCEDVRGAGLDAPLGAVFVKQASRWIEEAREHIYREETLPDLQRQNRRLWKHVHEDFAVWAKENPDATKAAGYAMKRALYEAWKQELGIE